jgi:protein-tyrosine-phosphatase
MGVRVLFVCTANAVRSQFAESLLRSIGGDRFDAFSAGVTPGDRVHPMTTRVLERAGVRTVGSHPKPLEKFSGESFDVIVTLSDEARAACEGVAIRAGQRIHWNIEDPGTELQFIETMKQIRRRVELFVTVTEAPTEVG